MCTLRRIADIASQAAQRRPAASSAPVPLSETELRDLQTLAASLTTSDLGLSRKDFTHPEITFISVAESPDYSIAIFVLPAGASLPLHDHVNMHVVTRVLWGSLEIREYDPLPDTFHSFKGFGPGCVAMRRPPVRAPTGAVRALTPTSGNVHSFHAHECTAVFDILVPPYDEHIGCRYYHAVELDNGDNSGILEASGEQVFLRVSAKCRELDLACSW